MKQKKEISNGTRKKLTLIVALLILALIVAGVVLIVNKNNSNEDLGPATIMSQSSKDKDKQEQDGNDNATEQDNAPEVIEIGDPNAPVTIIEYFSYFCGHCSRFNSEVLPKIKEKYVDTGQVRFVYRVFPPLEVSMSIICANDQGKFSEYHNYLFEHVSEIEKAEDLKVMAKEAGLNEAQFNNCYDFQEYLDEARAWYEQGQADFERENVPAEMRGTPAFFINGDLILGAQPFETFVQGIEEKLGE